MSVKIYNSLTRKKEEFTPLKEGQVGIYVCGPTVYDEPHIGHLRSAYIFDVIRRYLAYRGYKVKFVRNVTDVDDKIINKAKEKYPNEDINEAVKKVSAKYLESYHQAMEAFGIAKPDKEPKATEYVEKMKKFIQILIKRGAAYESGGDVYFDIKKAKDYGKLSNQSLDKMEVGARVSPGENKKDPLDFALWKSAKEGEPSWPSPWSNGRPGWHIECSVMSSELLGGEFDIHGGGIDLIFPHHENEVAQSEGAGNKFARYWIHNGLLTINGQKMAKSLGNFITVRDFINKYNDVNYLKLLFLGTHYRHPVDYTDEKIEEMKKIKEVLVIMLNNCEAIFKTLDAKQKKEIEKNATKDRKFEYIHSAFQEAMDDDFNMPRALAVLQDLIKQVNTAISYRQLTYNPTVLQELYFLRYILFREVVDIFGLSLTGFVENLTVEEQQLVDEYQKARNERDYKTSDEKRTQLNKLGIIIEETKNGTTWRKKI